MTKEELLKELANAMNRKNAISEDMVLDDIDEWDSLSRMCVITFFEDNFNKELTLEDLSKMTTVADLVKQAENVNES